MEFPYQICPVTVAHPGHFLKGSPDGRRPPEAPFDVPGEAGVAVDVLVRGQQSPQQLWPDLSRDVEGGGEFVDEAIDDGVEAARLEVQKEDA